MPKFCSLVFTHFNSHIAGNRDTMNRPDSFVDSQKSVFYPSQDILERFQFHIFRAVHKEFGEKVDAVTDVV